MKLGTALLLIGLLLSLTTRKSMWPTIDKRTIGQIYTDAKTGSLRSSRYKKVIAMISILLAIIGTYLSITSR